jgi:dihydrofolate reductase
MSNKVLCLHGFLQSGKVFSEKSSGLRKLLKKSGLQLDYIDGPITLTQKDLPFEVDDEKWNEIVNADINKAWFYHDSISKNLNIEKALSTISKHIEDNGPYIGIIGFSQGAAMSVIVSNIIKSKYGKDYFKFAVHIAGYTFTEPRDLENPNPDDLVITSQYVDHFTPPLDDPEYKTENIIIYGENDNSVPGKRTEYLANLYPEVLKMVYKHDGGHFVPNKKDFLRPLVEEIEKALISH